MANLIVAPRRLIGAPAPGEHPKRGVRDRSWPGRGKKDVRA